MARGDLTRDVERLLKESAALAGGFYLDVALQEPIGEGLDLGGDPPDGIGQGL